MLSIQLLIAALSIMVIIPAFGFLTLATAAAILFGPFPALLSVYAWVGTHIVSFVQSWFI